MLAMRRKLWQGEKDKSMQIGRVELSLLRFRKGSSEVGISALLTMRQSKVGRPNSAKAELEGRIDPSRETEKPLASMLDFRQ